MDPKGLAGEEVQATGVFTLPDLDGDNCWFGMVVVAHIPMIPDSEYVNGVLLRWIRCFQVAGSLAMTGTALATYSLAEGHYQG